MADEKLTALTAITVLVGTDIIYVVSDPGGSPLSRKITKDDFSKYPDGTVIFDSNGNEVIKVLKVASAVNEVTFLNAATAGQPEIRATGGDTNIDLLITGKGTGVPKVTSMKIVTILDTNGNELVKFTTAASAVNELTIVNAATATPVLIQTTGGDTNIDGKFDAKGTGTFYGVRETWAWPLTDEETLPVVDTIYVTEPAPYDMALEDVIAGLTVAGAGAALWTVDILKEDSVNANAFTTILSTLVTIDAAEYTSTTAATPPVISVATWEKGRRLQLKIALLDTDTLARGAKISLLAHATAR